MSDDILQRLIAVLESRKGSDPESSYVAGLYNKGLDSILKKIGEESAETIIAAKSGDKPQIVHNHFQQTRWQRFEDSPGPFMVILIGGFLFVAYIEKLLSG